MSVVCTGPLFHKIIESAENPVPLTVIVNVAAPACTVDGLRLVTVGMAGAMVKIELFDIVPLVLTVTVAAPCAPIWLALTAPVNKDAFAKTVARGAPFHRMTEFGENPEPFTA